MALPSAVRGPVDRSQGCLARHCSRSRCRSSAVQGRRSLAFAHPAATRLGFVTLLAPEPSGSQSSMTHLACDGFWGVTSQFVPRRKRNFPLVLGAVIHIDDLLAGGGDVLLV